MVVAGYFFLVYIYEFTCKVQRPIGKKYSMKKFIVKKKNKRRIWMNEQNMRENWWMIKNFGWPFFGVKNQFGFLFLFKFAQVYHQLTINTCNILEINQTTWLVIPKINVWTRNSYAHISNLSIDQSLNHSNRIESILNFYLISFKSKEKNWNKWDRFSL